MHQKFDSEDTSVQTYKKAKGLHGSPFGVSSLDECRSGYPMDEKILLKPTFFDLQILKSGNPIQESRNEAYLYQKLSNEQSNRGMLIKERNNS